MEYSGLPCGSGFCQTQPREDRFCANAEGQKIKKRRRGDKERRREILLPCFSSSPLLLFSSSLIKFLKLQFLQRAHQTSRRQYDRARPFFVRAYQLLPARRDRRGLLSIPR